MDCLDIQSVLRVTIHGAYASVGGRHCFTYEKAFRASVARLKEAICEGHSLDKEVYVGDACGIMGRSEDICRSPSLYGLCFRVDVVGGRGWANVCILASKANVTKGIRLGAEIEGYVARNGLGRN